MEIAELGSSQQKPGTTDLCGNGSFSMEMADYVAQLNVVKTEHQAVTTSYDDMSAALNAWKDGAVLAWRDYSDGSTDATEKIKDVFTKAFGSMDDAIINFATTGKFSFADFTKSILTDMIHIAAQQATSSLLTGLVGFAAKIFGSGDVAPGAPGTAQDGARIFASQFDPSAGGLTFSQAKGGAWNSGVQTFANGGAFANTVVSKPTVFGMSGGKTGVMGEAGPEAIMPLTRTSNGKLGVQAIGGGGGPGASPTVNISIASDGSSKVSSDTSGLEQFGKEMGEIAAQKYRELESRSLSSQGNIRNAINGR